MGKGADAAQRTQATDTNAVARMFGRIAPTYDLLNHLLSFGRDRAWRRRTAARLDAGRRRRVLDLATGTGDLLIAILKRHPHLDEAVGLDISEEMLAICRRKLRRQRLDGSVELLLADASKAPFADGSFDAVTMAFGIRNTADTPATLQEIYRLLKPGGEILILEFSLPKGSCMRWCYVQYLRFVVSIVGRLISGDPEAYRYLDRSIEAYHQPARFVSFMQEAGFRDVTVTPLTFGVASIYQGIKG